MTPPRGRPHVRLACGLVFAAWLVWLAGLGYGAWLQHQFLTPADDVADSPGRAAVLARRLLVFDALAAAADVAAGVLLLTATPGRVRGFLAAYLVWVVSLAVHGLSFFVRFVFAG